MEVKHESGFVAASAVHWVLLVAALGMASLGTLRIVSVPREALIANVVVDDAYYYIVPARNLLAGNGYSFDGEVRTNGVQPLWAAVTIGLTALLADEVFVLRAMCLLSGLCWIGAGAVLYRGLRSYDRWFGLFVATGFIFTGFWQRYAFQGMENGLHALLFALLVAFGIRHLRAPERAVSNYRPAFYLKLGLLLALITLTRVDGGLLALIIGALVLFGFIRPNPDSRPWINLPGAFFVALPGVVLVGAFVALSIQYFGHAMPISGKVKIFLESGFAGQHGGALRSIGWHLKFLSDIASIVFAEHLNVTLFRWFNWHWPADRMRTIVGVCLGLGWLVYVIRSWRFVPRGFSLLRPWHWFVAGVSAFVLVHLGTYAVMFPNFTPYCTWYFAPELMAYWLLLGVGFVLFGKIAMPRSQVVSDSLLGLFSLLVLAANVLPIARPPVADERTSQFHVAAEWMNEHVEGHQSIGAFSSGILGYFATKHQVINLDGLMNDYHYLDEYLSQNRIPEYARDRDITYLADYATIETWRGECFWGFRVPHMQLVRWWRMPGEQRYAIWKLLPDSEPRDVLSPCDGFCDRLSQVTYAAEIYGRYDMVEEEGLADYLARPDSVDTRVLTSTVVDECGTLAHIMVPEDLVTAINLTPDNLDIQRRLGIRFEDTLMLLGIDVPSWKARPGERFIITQYWQMIADEHSFADVSFELWFNPGDPSQRTSVPQQQLFVHGSRGCHGTCPVQRWKPGEVVAETRSIGVPYGLSAGVYPVMLVLYEPTSGWLWPDGRTPSAAVPTVHLGNLTIE